MNTNSKKLGIYLVIMLVLTAVATTFRSIACVMHMDYTAGFFSTKSLITAADIIIIITAAGMLSYPFVASRINLIASFSTSATYVTTGVLGVATAFLGARILSYTSIISSYLKSSQNVLPRTKALTLICAVCAIAAFASIAHHFFNAFITESKTEIRGYFSIATLVFLGLYAMMIYLDPSLAIGEPVKTLRLTAFLAASLFFIYESRISLGREMWRIYTSFGLVAAALAAYTAIPAIITYLANDVLLSYVNRRSFTSLEESIFLLALFVFITARLFITAFLYENNENSFIRAFKEYATDREREIAESASRYNEIFSSKQLSIFDLYGGEIIAEDEEQSEPIAESLEEEAETTPTISDDAIYESIFGKMPEKEPEAQEVADTADETDSDDSRKPEEIADEVLASLENAMNDAKSTENEIK